MFCVNNAYPVLDIDFLDASIIKKARKMAVAPNKDHIWKTVCDF